MARTEAETEYRDAKKSGRKGRERERQAVAMLVKLSEPAGETALDWKESREDPRVELRLSTTAAAQTKGQPPVSNRRQQENRQAFSEAVRTS